MSNTKFIALDIADTKLNGVSLNDMAIIVAFLLYEYCDKAAKAKNCSPLKFLELITQTVKAIIINPDL